MSGGGTSYCRAVLRSYGMVFFSRHGGLAALLLLVSFAHPAAGLAGLAGAGLAVGGARLGGFNREWTDSGIYGFNALLVGLALGAAYAPGWALVGLVGLGAALALLLSVALGGWLGGRGLPFLSLPFVLTMWLLTAGSALLPLPAAEAAHAPWLADVYALGGPRLVALAQAVADGPWPPLLAAYLRTLAAVVLQDSAAAGLLVALGLLWHSRIAFTLAGLAFLGAHGLLLLAGPGAGGFYETSLAANCVLTAVAVGGVFVVPSAASYGWALLSVPLTGLLLAALTAGLARLGLPVLSLPYCLAVLLLLSVLRLRERAGGWLVLTPVQRYSPEANLYAHATDRRRLAPAGMVPLTLPFLGAWRCTQGYLDGGPTHLGDWGQALDFAIADADGRTYDGSGLSLSDYYAYNKPVLAPAAGVVVEVVQHIEDNPIGAVNLVQNWGNTVVLRHAPGLYSQLSHLRPHAVPVKAGDQVRRGDVVGYCGNSGRSPEPHLHFQVQATPYVGSRTLAYPLAHFVAAGDAGAGLKVGQRAQQQVTARRPNRAATPPASVAVGRVEAVAAPDAAFQLRHFAVPQAGDTVRPPVFHRGLRRALRLPPGYVLEVRDATEPDTPPQCWEVFTDAYNLTYLRCRHTGAVAYFAGDESVFYCTAFYGPETSWLYLFYLAAYRVPLVSLPHQTTRDALPLTGVASAALRWAQDVLAPFHQFVRPTFVLDGLTAAEASAWPARTVRLRSRVVVHYFGREQVAQEAELLVRDGALAELRVQRAGQKVQLVFSTVGE